MKKNNNVLLFLVLILVLVGVYYLSIKNPTSSIVTPEGNYAEELIATPAPTQVVSEVPVVPIVSPTITITSPNGDEKLSLKKEATISWNQTGLNSNNMLSVVFRDENYESCNVGTVSATFGKMTFVPQDVKCQPGSTLKELETNEKYKIQLQATEYTSGMGVADYSDNFFTIAK